MTDIKADILAAVISIVVGTGIVITVVLGAALISFMFNRVSCTRYQEATGLESKLVGDLWVNGCFLSYDSKWIPAENYGMGFQK